MCRWFTFGFGLVTLRIQFAARISASAVRPRDTAILRATLCPALLDLLLLLRADQRIRLLAGLFANLPNLLSLLLSGERTVLANSDDLFSRVMMDLLHLLPNGSLHTRLLQADALSATYRYTDRWCRRRRGLR